jgi:chemotaxis protein methyltransferase CheR
MNTSLSPQDFGFVCGIVAHRSGLSLSDKQLYLAVSRLTPLAETHKFTSLHALVEACRHHPGNNWERLISEALATHETFFFRDPKTYDYIRDVIIPTLRRRCRAGQSLRIWSTACSTGQEVYSLLMALDEIDKRHPGLPSVTYEVVATDFSAAVVQRASEGIFADFDIRRGLSVAQRDAYCVPHGTDWQIKPMHRQRIRFEPMNLLDSFSRRGPVDLVLCRNVLIYFEEPAKVSISERLHEVLAADGYLVMGNSETVRTPRKLFSAVEPGRSSIFTKASAPAPVPG